MIRLIPHCQIASICNSLIYFEYALTSENTMLDVA